MDPSLRTRGTMTRGDIKMKPIKGTTTVPRLSNKKKFKILTSRKRVMRDTNFCVRPDCGENVLLDEPCRHINVPPSPPHSFHMK